MPATRTAVNWNNQWWTEVVHKEKTALEPQVNTKSGTRYKTDAEVEVKQLRRALLNIRKSMGALVQELDEQCPGCDAEEIVTRYVCSTQHYIDTLT
jgi:hypothetical protein